MPTCSNPHLGCMRPHSQTYGGGSHQVGKLFTFKVKDFTAAADSFQKHQLSVEERSRRLPCNRQVTVQSPSNQSNQKVFLCDFWQPVITWLTAVSVQKHEVQTLCVCAVVGPSAEQAKRRETEKLKRVHCCLLFTFLAHLPTNQTHASFEVRLGFWSTSSSELKHLR